jgi:hypothetical protein
MLAAALDLMIERVPRWIARSSGANVFEHIMDMGDEFGPLGLTQLHVIYPSLVPVCRG